MIGVILGGAFAGLALGMLGAGGTIIGLPLFLYLGGPQGHAAFGTNAFGVTIIALLLLCWRIGKGQINIPLGIVFTIPGLVGIGIGAHLGLLYPAKKLIFLLSFLILIVGGWILYLSTQPEKAASDTKGGITRGQIVRIVPTALVIGLISGFFAIGGGFLVVPGLAIAAGIDLRGSARTSLLPITAFAGLDAIEYTMAGDVRFDLAGIMIVAGLVGGGVGIMLANRLRLPLIQRIFAVFLACIAIYMLAQHIHA